MKKTFLLTVVALALLLLGAFLLVPQFDTDVVARELVQQVARSSGLQITSTEMDLDLLRGVRLEGISIDGRIPAGDLSVQIDSVRLRHRWLPLLRGRLEIGAVSLEHPQVELVSRQITPSTVGRPDRAAARREKKRRRHLEQVSQEPEPEPSISTVGEAVAPAVALAIERVVVRRGEIAARTAESDEVDFLAEEVEVRLRDLRYEAEPDSWTHAISGRGSVSTGLLRHGGFAADRTSGSLAVDDGIAKIDDLEVRTQHARIESEPVVVLLAENPPRYSLRSRGEIDLNGMVGSGMEDVDFGPVSFSIEAAGIGPEWVTLTGVGSALIGAGKFPPIPAVVDVESTLGRELLTGRAYEEVRVDFAIRDQRVWLEPFELTGEGGAIEVSGTVGLGGDRILALELIVHLEPDRLGIEGAVVELLDRLVGESGRLSVPLAVGGTLEDPTVGLGDRDTFAEPVGQERTGAFDRRIEEVKAKVDEWLAEQASGSSEEP